METDKKPVLRLVVDNGLGAIKDLGRLLLAPHGGEAVHKDCCGLGFLHRRPVHLEGA
jgi:hypothetical protein